MRIVFFLHSVRSDWNNGHAHFLRGVVTELQRRGHDVIVYEPEDGWSASNLVEEAGAAALEGFRTVYPGIDVALYGESALLASGGLDGALDGADLVLVHEWNSHALVSAIGLHRKRQTYQLLFHDTHHRSVSEPDAMAACDLSEYDGVLTAGASRREWYLEGGWARRVWVWHEAADIAVFHPMTRKPRGEQLVWIGNWGDGDRTQELWEFLMAPVQAMGIKAVVYGVRYPREAQAALGLAGCVYEGWLPNYLVPCVFAEFPLTIHIPRRSYVNQLSGVPTLRPFEALACGIPLVSAPWTDIEGLFEPGRDFLIARNEREMVSHVRQLLNDSALADELAVHGLKTILTRHTCAHRVSELLEIYGSIAGPQKAKAALAPEWIS